MIVEQFIPDLAYTPSPEEQAQEQAAYNEYTTAWATAEATGLAFVKGCSCCGSNTPELIGRCPCQGIDLRKEDTNAKAS